MKKTGDNSYMQNGVTIDFKHSNKDLYSFEVRDDPETTGKLIASVKRKRVSKDSFWLCAKALFTIIENDEFVELITLQEFRKLLSDFEEKFKEKSDMITENYSDPNDPCFTAMVRNDGFSLSTHSGRTKRQAMSLALREALEKGKA